LAKSEKSAGFWGRFAAQSPASQLPHRPPRLNALVHVALYLRSAYETGYKALDYMREEGRGMFWSTLHAIEMAEGVIEAILDGIESTPPPTNRPSQA
jgi:hypothetical protein